MKAAVCLALALSVASAQNVDRVSIPFSNPNGPKKMEVKTLHGGITIQGYDGAEVVVEARGGRASSRRGPSQYEGLKRIDAGGGSFTAEEQDNTIRISGSPMGSGADLTIQVPRDTNISAKAMRGTLSVTGVNAEIEAHNLNGNVELTAVSGTALAHSLNGDVKVAMDQVNPSKPMSFSTLNGDIDVALPAGTKARLKLKSDHGDVYTDFDLQMESSGSNIVEEGTKGKGRYRVKVDRTLFGTINGGGPLFSFTTLNGKILLRKK